MKGQHLSNGCSLFMQKYEWLIINNNNRISVEPYSRKLQIINIIVHTLNVTVGLCLTIPSLMQYLMYLGLLSQPQACVCCI